MTKAKELATAGMMGTILVVSKIALDGLPSVELVSLFIIVYALELPKLTLPAIYVYLGIYGLLNGFGIWWFPQLYIWPLLYVGVRAVHRWESRLLIAVLSAMFGLFFGAFYAISYAIVGGVAGGIAWWVAGIPFDIFHCIGNFVVTLALLNPLRRTVVRCKQAGILL